MMRLLGLILATGVVVLGVFVTKGDLHGILDKPTVVFLAGFTLGSLLLNGVSIPLLIRSIYSGSLETSEIREAAHGWSEAKTAVQVGGWASFLLGFSLSANWADVADHIGPIAGLLSLSVFYALLFAYLICRPMQSRMEQKLRVIEA